MLAQITPRGRALESQEKAFVAARAALEKQAEGVVVMDLRSLSSITDFFVVCTADNARQLSALQEHIERTLGARGALVWHTEGITSTQGRTSSRLTPEPQWVLLDCGEIVVHLLDRPARELYRLEDLWADAPRLPIPPA